MYVNPSSEDFQKHLSAAKVFTHAVRNGWMGENQYRYIAERLIADADANLLVFGLGHDAFLWSHCVQGRVAYVEDNSTYLTTAPAESRVILYRYDSQVGKWVDVPAPPSLISSSWSYVLVDGPAGFGPNSPGRQIPITWAGQLATRHVFVHDYERPWEREVCDTILGQPVDIVKSTGHRRGDLAVFDLTAASSKNQEIPQS